MAKLTGSIDDRGRPVVRLEWRDESLLCVVDTGFNGDLLLSATAARSVGITEGSYVSEIELGDGRLSRVTRNLLVVAWLGETRSMSVLISDSWNPRADDPVGLIGTGLLSPHLLLIDFGQRLVEIETQ